MRRIFEQQHQPIAFTFKQTRDDFIVDEIPLDRVRDKGNYLIAKVQKQNLSTMEMLAYFERELGECKIGYAGLKDRNATTTQYISLPLKFAERFEKLRYGKITILETFRSDKGIDIGDLEGNHFQIRLHDVSENASYELINVLQDIQRKGMPNYFGYQRFGRDENNQEQAREIAHGEKLIKDKKLEKIMLHAHQSYLFNAWLVERMAIQSEPKCGYLSLLEGDVLLNTQTHTWENAADLSVVKKPLKEQKLIPTGLLSGQKTWHAKGVAAEIEEKYNDLLVQAKGDRRAAWVFPKKIRYDYDKEERSFTLSFELPKGSYATVLLENLANRDLTPSL